MKRMMAVLMLALSAWMLMTATAVAHGEEFFIEVTCDHVTTTKPMIEVTLRREDQTETKYDANGTYMYNLPGSNAHGRVIGFIVEFNDESTGDQPVPACPTLPTTTTTAPAATTTTTMKQATTTTTAKAQGTTSTTISTKTQAYVPTTFDIKDVERNVGSHAPSYGPGEARTELPATGGDGGWLICLGVGCLAVGLALRAYQLQRDNRR